jgi:hypothetical protein
MGMYSYFTTDDLEIIDYDGLVDFLERWEQMLKEEGETEEWGRLMSRKALLNEKEKTISFSCWNDIKLISYWYDLEVIFLKCIAKYLIGTIVWDFESEEEAGWVEFENGDCIIHTGQMTWANMGAMEMLGDAWERECPCGRTEEKLKKFLMLSEI